jgi:hypothetical protein
MRSLRRKRLFQKYKIGDSRRYLLRQQNVRGNRHIQRTRLRRDLVGVVSPGAPFSSSYDLDHAVSFVSRSVRSGRTAECAGIRHRNQCAVMRRECYIKNSAQGEREARDRPRDREASPTTSHRAGPRLDVSRGKHPLRFLQTVEDRFQACELPLHLADGHQ